MNSKFYKPIGEIIKSGLSVNGPDAFIRSNPIPLRARKDNKAIDNKPLKPAVGESLGLRQAPKEKAKFMPEKVKNNQRKVREATSTPRDTSAKTAMSTTGSTSTTTQNIETSTSTTMGRTNNRSSSGRNNDTSTTSGNRRFDNPSFTSSTFVEPSKDMTAFNVYDKEGDSQPYIVQGLNQDVSYFPKQPANCLLRPDVVSGGLINKEVNPKLLINLSSFSLAISEAGANTVNYYDIFLRLLYSRYTADIMRITKGTVPSFWTSANFRTAMASVCAALQYYYCIDVRLAFQNIGVSGMTGSRTLEEYGHIFNTPEILKARDDLRRYLQGCWFPPAFSLFLRGFFQYYRTTPNAGQASIFNYACSSDFVLNLNNSSTLSSTIVAAVEALRVNLQVESTVQIMGLLSNTHPIGIINGMPKSSIDARYNEDMLEVFINEPTLYCDPNSTNTQSITPISYNATANDIPYYSMKDPRNMNGTAFALQCIGVTTATSGHVYTDAGKYYGIRRLIGALSNPSTCNKFVLDVANRTVLQRNCTNAPIMASSGVDAHTVYNIANATTQISYAPLSCQRVYFDSQNSPSTLFNILCSTLYGTAV